MKKFISLLTTIILLTCCPSMVLAQSADASYRRGVELMRSKKHAEAIAYFQEAKNIDKSPQNQARCNAKIKECRAAINPIPKKPSLTIDKHSLSFDASPTTGQTLRVTAIPNATEWTVEIQQGGEWLSTEKASDGCSLTIKSEKNSSISQRTGMIILSTETLKDTVHITQNALPVYLKSPKNTLEFKTADDQKKGFKKIVYWFRKLFKLDCDYELAIVPIETNLPIPEGRKRSWNVTFSENWVSESTNEKDQQKAEAYMAEYLNGIGENTENQSWPTLQNRVLVVRVNKMTKNDPNYLFGRTAEISLKSAQSSDMDLEHKILVRQLGKSQKP